MIATIINGALILLGCALGLTLKGRFSQNLSRTITHCLGLCVLGIGLSSLLKTGDTLCLIICMVLGTLLGEGLNIEEAMERVGQTLKRTLRKDRGDSRFVEGFVTATVVYCVGAMAVNGSIAAGLHRDYSILLSKGVLDGVSAITFSAAMGVGVAFSVVPLVLYQGGITLLAGVVGPLLDPAAVNEMSAAGGAIIAGIALNMLELPRERLRVGNMLPAILLPLAYLPITAWLGGLMG